MGRLQSVIRNKNNVNIAGQDGVSLVEVLIALVVLLLVFMGLLQAALLGIDSNMRNILRDEAVTVAAMRMEEARSIPFDNVVPDTATITGADCPDTFTIGERLERNLRNTTKDFCVNLTCRDLENDKDCVLNDSTCNTKQINVRVIWNWKDQDYIHSATTLRRR
jgi:prepilin-type N-terminal cleavage/methylation domain-containing protein